MWSTLKISSGAQLGHDKRDIPALDTVLFHSNLSSLRRKHLGDVPKDKMVLSSGPKISKRPFKRRYWQLTNKERKCHFRFAERRFLAAINCTGNRGRSARASLSPHHTLAQERTARSPPGLFPPWIRRSLARWYDGVICNVLSGGSPKLIMNVCQRSSSKKILINAIDHFILKFSLTVRPRRHKLKK